MPFSRMIAAAGLCLAVSATAAVADDMGNAEHGEKVFGKCKACHMVGPDAKNRVGPELNGVVGRKPAGVEDYKYSSAFSDWAADKDAWTPDLLDPWLENPKDVVPKTKMVFAGLKKDEDRRDVIAYLASFDASGQKQDPESLLKGDHDGDKKDSD